MPAGRCQLDMGAARIRAHTLDVLADDVELFALLVHHMGDVAEQLVELAHRLLDIADLGLALDDERFLEVDLVLRRQAQLVLLLELLLLLLLLATALLVGGVVRVFEGGAGGGGGGAFLFNGAALEDLEFGEGGLEFAVQFALGEFLGWLLGGEDVSIQSWSKHLTQVFFCRKQQCFVVFAVPFNVRNGR